MTSQTAQEIAETIRDRIRTGVYLPRTRVPSQVILAIEFRASSRTIAQAITDLRDRGYLWTLPHKGGYARPQEHWRDIDAETSDG